MTSLTTALVLAALALGAGVEDDPALDDLESSALVGRAGGQLAGAAELAHAAVLAGAARLGEDLHQLVGHSTPILFRRWLQLQRLLPRLNPSNDPLRCHRQAVV